MVAFIPPAACGFKLIVRGRAIPCRTLDELAGSLADAFGECTAARAVARTSLTRDRDLTEDEHAEVIRRATGLIEREVV